MQYNEVLLMKDIRVIILAGGKGTRLKPYTTVFPKPLMPIGDMPILEVVLRQLKSFGFEKITLSVNHLADLIQTFFGNGSKLGLDISYCMEDTAAWHSRLNFTGRKYYRTFSCDEWRPAYNAGLWCDDAPSH